MDPGDELTAEIEEMAARLAVERAQADSQRLKDDPGDQAEILEIQRFMGLAE